MTPKHDHQTPSDVILSIERWQPYDQAAWEAVLSQLTTILVPYMGKSRELAES